MGAARQFRQGGETWGDPAGNVIGLIKGARPGTKTNQSIRIMAHLDEIAMLVKRIESDGTLRVVALGGVNPINFGVCPVDILGDRDSFLTCWNSC